MTEIAANAAEDSATSATELVTSAERQLRAYVHVMEATILHANDEYQPNFRIEIKNYGQTPAYRVADDCTTSLALAGEPSFKLIEERTNYSDLGPSQTHVTTMLISDNAWTTLIKPAIERGVPFYVYGEVTYFEVFQIRTPLSHA